MNPYTIANLAQLQLPKQIGCHEGEFEENKPICPKIGGVMKFWMRMSDKNRSVVARKMPDMIRFFEGLRLAYESGKLKTNPEWEAMSDKVCDDLERELIIRRIDNIDTLLLTCLSVTMLKYDKPVPLLSKLNILLYPPKQLFCECLEHCFEFLK